MAIHSKLLIKRNLLLLFAITFMLTLVLFVQVKQANASNPTGASVGAIRWDAWIGETSTESSISGITTNVGANFGLRVERSLSPSQFHFRVPFYGIETGTDSVQTRENQQFIMDEEIKYAKASGIDYWAYYFYADNSGFDSARKLHQTSAFKNDVKFTYIIDPTHMPASNFSQVITAFQQSNYMKVLSGRPLLYLYGGYSNSDLLSLDTLSTAAGLPPPYIVDMTGSSTARINAWSRYNTWASGGGAYSGLITADQSNWNSLRTAGKKVVPWVTTGIDNRTRYLNQVWGGFLVGANDWVQTATPTEIGTNLQNALNWINTYPTVGEANTVIMYAWNEFDEGGWINPTLFNGTDRLDAIKNIVDPGNSIATSNLALGKTYSSSSQLDAGHAAGKAFDANLLTSNWQALSGFNGEWLQVDFGSNTTFNKVTLRETSQLTTGYRIEYWNGSSWLTAKTGTKITTGLHVTFPAVTGSKARIYFTGGSSTPSINEFEVYNIAMPAATPTPMPTMAPTPTPGSNIGLVTYRKLSTTIRNNFSGKVGFKFTTGGGASLTIKELGRYYYPGGTFSANTGTHTVSLYRDSDKALLGSCSVDTSTGTADGLGFKFCTLASDVVLSANSVYIVVSDETNGGDRWYDGDTAYSIATGLESNAVYYQSGSWGNAGYSGQSYGPVNLKYAGSATPTPTPTPTPSPGYTSYNDSVTGTGSNQFEYVGSWSTETRSGSYNNDQHYTNTTNDYANFRFTGTRVKFHADYKSGQRGKIAISLDGGTETIIDQNNTDALDQILYDSGTISNTSHTLKVRCTGQTTSSVTYVTVDRVEVQTSGSATIVNDNVTGTGNNQFEFVSHWAYQAQTAAYSSDETYTNTKNDYFQVRFNGTQIKWHGAKNATSGIVAVSIDGGAETNIDTYASSRQDDVVLYDSGTLTSGQHTLKVRNTGTKNSSSSNYYITADRVEIY